jgi:very-short-patch-repair endonuclease
MTRVDISEAYTRYDIGKTVAYYLDKFAYHIKQKHGLTMKDYCKTYLKVEWPCIPGTNEEVGCKTSGKGLLLSMFGRGKINRRNCPAFDESCRQLSEKRKGSGNPMFGKHGWNLGKTAATDERMARIAESRQNCKASDQARENMSKAHLGKPSKTKGTHIHTAERREWFKGHTARLWARGVFNRTTGIHIKMREFLLTLKTDEAFEEEYVIGPFSVDFAFPVHKIAVESDGDYYHVNPEFYPNGPENAMQRRNFGRDKAKNAYLATCGWTVIRAWEHHINDGSFKNPVTCKLKESGLLNA